MKARTWLIGAAVICLLVVAGGYGWLRFGPQGKRAELASGYVAHVVCSCRYVGGRDMQSCATDLEPGMEIVQMADDPAAKRITAWVSPGIARRSARYEGEFGCTFDE